MPFQTFVISFLLHAKNETEIHTHDLFYLLRDDNGSLLRDVETVQELTDILVLDSGGLLDASGRLGDGFDVVTVDVELVLLCLGDLDGDTLGHGDLAEELLAQEVAHLEGGTTINNGAVDGEMGIGGTELVSETKRNTLKRGDPCVRQVPSTYLVSDEGDTNLAHVGDVGADGADGGLVAGAAQPLLDENGFLGGVFHLDLDKNSSRNNS